MEADIKIDYLGHSLYYRVAGKGRPVLLVHGFGETGDVWKNQMTLLDQTGAVKSEHLLPKDSFRFIVPDLPGSGQSAMTADMSMEGMADALKFIIDKEIAGQQSTPEEVILVGHSMGGYTALAFAEKYGSYLSAFGLFHSTAYADSEEKKAARRKGIEFIREHGAFDFLKNTSPNLFSPLTHETSPGMINSFIQSLEDFTPEALIAYYEAMMSRRDRTAVLKKMKIPVLFVLGELDNIIPLKDGLEQTHLPDISSIHILAHSGHMGMLEEKEKSGKILADFLQSL